MAEILPAVTWSKKLFIWSAGLVFAGIYLQTTNYAWLSESWTLGLGRSIVLVGLVGCCVMAVLWWLSSRRVNGQTYAVAGPVIFDDLAMESSSLLSPRARKLIKNASLGSLAAVSVVVAVVLLQEYQMISDSVAAAIVMSMMSILIVVVAIAMIRYRPTDRYQALRQFCYKNNYQFHERPAPSLGASRTVGGRLNTNWSIAGSYRDHKFTIELVVRSERRAYVPYYVVSTAIKQPALPTAQLNDLNHKLVASEFALSDGESGSLTLVSSVVASTFTAQTASRIFHSLDAVIDESID